MEVRKICQWCGKPFIAKKTTTCYCSHQCSNLGYKERIRERKRQMRKMQELLQPKQAAEGQDFFSFAQAARLMGVTRQYVYKLVKESKLRASRISEKKSLIRSQSQSPPIQLLQQEAYRCGIRQIQDGRCPDRMVHTGRD